MFRILCGAALAVSLCGCASFPADYVVKEDGAEVTVYKPGTLFKQVNTAEEVWIKIPMVRVKGCPGGKLEFEHKPSRTHWTLKTEQFGATTVRFEEVSFKTLAASKRALTVLHSAADSGIDGCGLELGPDAPTFPKDSSLDAKRLPRQLLDILVAERLPTTAASSWVDQFDFDEKTRSINILPGMRLKVQPELPFTADADDSIDPFHPGILSSPMYLELAAVDKDDPGKGQWSTSLGKFGFRRPVDVGGPASQRRPWHSASGMSDLGTDARFWRLFVPKELAPSKVITSVEPCDAECLTAKSQVRSAPFVAEQFAKNYEDHPGFTLVGSVDRAALEDMLNKLATDPKGVNLTGACKDFNVSTNCFVFRFRAVVSPEIPVVVNRQMVWIEPGTTVFHLLQRFSAGQIQEHFGSPLAGATNAADRDGVSDTLMKLRLEQLWDTAAKDLALWRRFEGVLVPVRAADMSNAALLEVVLQMGDEISWSR